MWRPLVMDYDAQIEKRKIPPFNEYNAATDCSNIEMPKIRRSHICSASSVRTPNNG
jgi:hypothetical protein